MLALEQAALLVVGLDQVMGAMNLEKPQWSALRTRLEHAKTKATAVLRFIERQRT